MVYSWAITQQPHIPYFSCGLNTSYSLIVPFLNLILSTMPVSPVLQTTTLWNTPEPLTFHLGSPHTGWGDGVFQQINYFCSFCKYSHLAIQWLVPQPVLAGNKARMWNDSLFNGIVKGTVFSLEIIHFLINYTLLLCFNIIQIIFLRCYL